MAENELMHHGVRGMKWYQHIFGEYQSGAKYAKKGTAAKPSGKKTTALRRAKAKKAADDVAEKKASREKAIKQLIADPVKKMSDQELLARINRLQNEQKYKELSRGRQSVLKRGAKAVGGILSTSGKQVASKYVTQWMDNQVKRLLEDKDKEKKDK